MLNDISQEATIYHHQGSDVEKAPVARKVLEKYSEFASLLEEAKLPIEQLHCVKVAIEVGELIFGLSVLKYRPRRGRSFS